MPLFVLRLIGDNSTVNIAVQSYKAIPCALVFLIIWKGLYLMTTPTVQSISHVGCSCHRAVNQFIFAFGALYAGGGLRHSRRRVITPVYRKRPDSCGVSSFHPKRCDEHVVDHMTTDTHAASVSVNRVLHTPCIALHRVQILIHFFVLVCPSV